jgi:hypothetical protein
MASERYTDADVELAAGIIADHQHWTGVHYTEAARAVLDALTAACWRKAPDGFRLQADRDGDMTLQCLTCFADHDLDQARNDITLSLLIDTAVAHQHQGGTNV